MNRPIKKLLAANRSEIATRVFRSAHELGVRTVALYSHEDRFALHRFKADEAYQIGKAGEPIRSYLDIDGIVALCKRYEIDAVHPGYGFLSENPDFARALEKAGITFVGPSVEALERWGDKVAAREIAVQAGVPVLPGSGSAVSGPEEAKKLAAEMGYSTAGLANAWVLAQGEQVISIPGTRSVTHLKQLAEGVEKPLGAAELARIEEVLPVGWAAGDRYSVAQNDGPERYC